MSDDTLRKVTTGNYAAEAVFDAAVELAGMDRGSVGFDYQLRELHRHVKRWRDRRQYDERTEQLRTRTEAKSPERLQEILIDIHRRIDALMEFVKMSDESRTI